MFPFRKMDTVTANHVLFFFFFTYYAKIKSLFAHSFPRECAENDKKKKKEMDFGKVNTSIFPEDAKPCLTKKLALI